MHARIHASRGTCLTADPLLIWTYPYTRQFTHTICTVRFQLSVQYGLCVWIVAYREWVQIKSGSAIKHVPWSSYPYHSFERTHRISEESIRDLHVMHMVTVLLISSRLSIAITRWMSVELACSRCIACWCQLPVDTQSVVIPGNSWRTYHSTKFKKSPSDLLMIHFIRFILFSLIFTGVNVLLFCSGEWSMGTGALKQAGQVCTYVCVRDW